MDCRLNTLHSTDSLECLNSDCLQEVFLNNSAEEMLVLRQVSIKAYATATKILLLQEHPRFLIFQKNLFIRWAHDSSFIRGKIIPNDLIRSIKHLKHNMLERIYGLLAIQKLQGSPLNLKLEDLFLENTEYNLINSSSAGQAAKELNVIAIIPIENPNTSATRLVNMSKTEALSLTSSKSNQLNYYANAAFEILFSKISNEVIRDDLISLAIKCQYGLQNSSTKILKDYPNLLKPSQLIKLLDSIRNQNRYFSIYYDSPEFLAKVLVNFSSDSNLEILDILNIYFETFTIDSWESKREDWKLKLQCKFPEEKRLNISKLQIFTLKKILAEFQKLDNKYYYDANRNSIRSGVGEGLIILEALESILDPESVTIILRLFAKEVFVEKFALPKTQDLFLKLTTKFSPENVLEILAIYSENVGKKMLKLDKLDFVLNYLSSLANLYIDNELLNKGFFKIFESMIKSFPNIPNYLYGKDGYLKCLKSITPRLNPEEVSIFLQKVIEDYSANPSFVRFIAKIAFFFPSKVIQNVFQSTIINLKNNNSSCDPELLSIIVSKLDPSDISWIRDNILTPSINKLKSINNNAELDYKVIKYFLASLLTRSQFLEILEPPSNFSLFNMLIYETITKINFKLTAEEVSLISVKLEESLDSNTYFGFKSLQVLSTMNTPQQIESILSTIRDKLMSDDTIGLFVVEYLIVIAPRFNKYKKVTEFIPISQIINKFQYTYESQILQLLTLLTPHLSFEEVKMTLEPVIERLSNPFVHNQAKDLLCLYIQLGKCTIEDLENAKLSDYPFAELIRFFAELNKQVYNA